MGRKALKTLIKENKMLITTGCVFFSYETQINGDDGYLVRIANLTDEQLNKRYLEREWWIEDGDLCIKYKR